MKFSTLCAVCAMLVAGFGVLTNECLSAQAEGSLTDLGIEYSELKVTLSRILGENRELRNALAETQKTLADMRQNLAASTAETELFKRRSAELCLRVEALGLDLAGGDNPKLEQRLLAAVSDLRATRLENERLAKCLVQLSDAAAGYAVNASSAPPESRLALESEIRNASSTLAFQASNLRKFDDPNAIAGKLTTISVKQDLSLIVINSGAQHGMRIGTPLRVMRGDKFLGSVQVVDVREKISGAIIQYLSSEQEQIKIGDYLVVDAK